MHGDRDLDAVGGVELGQDPRHMCFDSRHTHEEFGGDLGVGLAGADGHGDLELAFAELGQSSASRSRSIDAGGAGEVSATCRMSCAVTLGDRIGSPSTTRCTASTIVAGGVSLRRKPLAPSRSAATTYSSASNVVSTITAGPSSAAASCLVASIPSIFGIRMSMSTTSGRSRPISSSPAAPSPAWPTMSIVFGAAQDHRQSSPDQRVVVDDDHADRVGAAGLGSHDSHGSQARTTNSPAGVCPCSIRPLAKVTRSVSPTRPRPDPGVGVPDVRIRRGPGCGPRR